MFIGAPFSEAHLLGDGYAVEQTLNIRQPNPPSFTNPSMWRCVPYSFFFSPHHCNSGDLESDAYGKNYSAGPPEFSVSTDVGGSVAPSLELSLGTVSTSLGTFVPGVAADYTASLAASATSTGGDATLTAVDPGTTSLGHLVNGSFALASPLALKASSPAGTGGAYAPLSGSPVTLLSYVTPTTNDPVTLGFKQSIGGTEALRTGTYAKTVLLSLSTTHP